MIVMQTDFSDNTRKGQSAIEYLTTYGWALLAIVIVGAVLMQMGVFSQCSTTSPRFTGQSVAMADWGFIDSTNVSMELEAIDQDVNVTQVELDYGDNTVPQSYANKDIAAGTSAIVFVDVTDAGLTSGECASADVSLTADVGNIPSKQMAGSGAMTGPVP